MQSELLCKLRIQLISRSSGRSKLSRGLEESRRLSVFFLQSMLCYI